MSAVIILMILLCMVAVPQGKIFAGEEDNQTTPTVQTEETQEVVAPASAEDQQGESEPKLSEVEDFTEDVEQAEGPLSDGSSNETVAEEPAELQQSDAETIEGQFTEQEVEEDEDTNVETNEANEADPAPVVADADPQGEEDSDQEVDPAVDEVSTELDPQDEAELDAPADEPTQTESIESATGTEEVQNQENLIEISGIVPDPYFYVGGTKHSFLPEGGSCEGIDHCSVSTTPIQDALDAVAGGLTPDDSTVYVEGGIYNEDINFVGMNSLTLQGAADGQSSTLAGNILIIDSQSIALREFIFLKAINLVDATDISIVATTQDDQIQIAISGSSEVDVEAEDGDDEITVQGSHGEVDVDGGAGNDILTIDFILDDDPADALITFDGGDDFDVLEVTGGSFNTVTDLPSDPSSGLIFYDDAQVVYTNIEPKYEYTSAETYNPSGTSGGDTVTIANGGKKYDSSSCASGCQTIEIQSGAFENIFFANKKKVTFSGSSGNDTITLNFSKLADGLESLKVEGGESTISVTSDDDKIFVAGTIDMQGGDLTLEAEQIFVNANQIISTRKLADGETNYETALSTGDSGDIKLKGHHIKIENGAKLFAHVENNSSHSAGDIEFTVYDDAGLDLSFYNRDDSNVSITIEENAVLRGSTV